jgi:hypothetical protein
VLRNTRTLTEFGATLVNLDQISLREDAVRSHSTLVIILGAVLSVLACSSVHAAQPPHDACSLLTQTQVSGILGVGVNAGVHPAGDVPNSQLNCQWSQSAQGASNPKRVILDIFEAVENRSPADRFENAKKEVRGVTKTPVSGVGDEAFYSESSVNTILYVKKGSFVFQIIVAGFSTEQIKAMEKALAQAVVAKQ